MHTYQDQAESCVSPSVYLVIQGPSFHYEHVAIDGDEHHAEQRCRHAHHDYMSCNTRTKTYS